MRLRDNVILLAVVTQLFPIQYPSPPQEPIVAQPQLDIPSKQGGTKKTKQATVVPQINVRLRIHLGDKSVLLAEAQIPAVYSFAHKKGQVQYNQTIHAEDIRELTIENYRARKVSSSKEGDLYEFEPAHIRIELKDGQVFKLPYLFKEMRKLKGRNADGAFSVFAFFADTFKQRGGWQERGGEELTVITKRPHPAAFTRLEYFDPVDKTGATAGVEKEPSVLSK